MAMLRKIGRLFVIKTRFEAFAVTYAIAVGSVERGLHYMHQLPGYNGYILAAACLGVPFLAGAKLLDSVRKPAPVTGTVAQMPPRRRHQHPRSISRIRPTGSRMQSGSRLRSRHHKD